MDRVAEVREKLNKYVAPNYRPLPFVPRFAKGEWLYGFVEGSEGFQAVLDLHSTYSATSLGHNNSDIIDLEMLRLCENRPSKTARGAVELSELADFAEKLVNLCGMEMMIPKNSGYEAFDVAVKTVRKWAYERKGVLRDNAKIIVCVNNFHGRGGFAINASSEPLHRDGFGPFSQSTFIKIPFGDIEALKNAITDTTAAFIVEPIQAEAGIIIPPLGYLRQARQICKENDVLFILDEIQTGLGRTGKLFAWQHDGKAAKPDGILLGKALGGGADVISAFVSSRDVLSVLTEGTEGSTFGGTPEACAVAMKALELLSDPCLLQRVDVLGKKFTEKLRTLQSPFIKEVRGRGFLIALELKASAGGARRFREALLREGILSVQRHENVLGFSPPLNINEHNLMIYAFERIRRVFSAND